MHLIFYWSVVDIGCYTSFRYATQWFSNCTHCVVLTTVSVVISCHHTHFYSIIDYFPLCCTFHPCELFILSLIPLPVLSIPPGHSTLETTNLFFVFMCLFLFGWLFNCAVSWFFSFLNTSPSLHYSFVS